MYEALSPDLPSNLLSLPPPPPTSSPLREAFRRADRPPPRARRQPAARAQTSQSLGARAVGRAGSSEHTRGAP
eukprot:7261034-Prymnesium_polylepis.1